MTDWCSVLYLSIIIHICLIHHQIYHILNGIRGCHRYHFLRKTVPRCCFSWEKKHPPVLPTMVGKVTSDIMGVSFFFFFLQARQCGKVKVHLHGTHHKPDFTVEKFRVWPCRLVIACDEHAHGSRYCPGTDHEHTYVNRTRRGGSDLGLPDKPPYQNEDKFLYSAVFLKYAKHVHPDNMLN